MKTRNLIALSILGTGLAGVFLPRATHADTQQLPNTGLADPENFLRLYSQWRATAPRDTVSLGLVSIAALASESVSAAGAVKVNTSTGAVSANVAGLPDGNWELMLIDNAPDGSTLYEAADRALNAGRFTKAEGAYVLSTTLTAAQRSGFAFDRAVVVRAGQPASAFVLTGSANIYNRIAAGYVSEGAVWDLAAKGRALFNTERFAGNSRTCGTCHVEANNFTIDAEFIAKLSATDPLFVHERSADLRNNFESAANLRKAGLVLANADGSEDLAKKFVLRAVPSIQSVGTQSTAPQLPFVIDFTQVGQSPDQPERLGWGNDNLPVREFAIGAIIQHMPKTLARKAGTDFRVPSDEELDALAVFQLSVGRPEDFDLAKLKLRTAIGAQGMRLFGDTGNIAEPGHKNCNACHFNAGGTAALSFNDGVPGFSPKLDALPRGFNMTAGTNVNGLPASIALNIPRDGGYGSMLLPTGGFGNFGELPGVGVVPFEEFNSNSLVESADTAPYFHNHAVATLEEAVAFYGTKAYSDPISIGDPVAGPIPVKISDDPNDPEVQAISAFLRVLNGLENIRSTISALERARRAGSIEDARELTALGREELSDAIQVLSSGALERRPDFAVLIARGRLIAARGQLDGGRNAASVAAMEASLQTALQSLRGARESLVDPSTLPASLRN
jgi:cytochrome c peroxidase